MSDNLRGNRAPHSYPFAGVLCHQSPPLKAQEFLVWPCRTPLEFHYPSCSAFWPVYIATNHLCACIPSPHDSYIIDAPPSNRLYPIAQILMSTDHHDISFFNKGKTAECFLFLNEG